jgi:hypothetical protein
MEEYKQIALSFKDQGNTAFQAGDNQLAIDYYTQVLLLLLLLKIQQIM